VNGEEEGEERTYIKTSSSNICAYQGTLFGVTELEECVCALLLLLLSVEIENGEVDVVEELGVVFDICAAGEEDNDLFLEVAFEE